MVRGPSKIFLTVLGLLIMVSLVLSESGKKALADASQPGISRTVVVSGLNNPWDLAFAPDGAMLFTEKCRGLSVRLPDGSIRFLFGTDGAILEAADFFCQGQSGMLGVALDPDFENNRRVYLYMASEQNRIKTNRVVRLVIDKGYAKVSQRTDIVTDISFKESSSRWGRAGAHSGGRIRFSPFDGYLYVTTGDNHNGPLPQDLSRLGGKVLRIDGNGDPAPGNSTPAGKDPRIFTFGHRNVQGIDFHPGTGQAFACEHGPGHDDEVTPLEPGGNGGWDPTPLPGVSCADNYCGYISNRPDGRPTSMTDLERYPDALRPSWNNRGDSEGMSPCVFLQGQHWKNWENRLAVGFLRGARIEILELDDEKMAANTTIMPGLPGERIRSLVLGPEKALYVAIDGGQIWRIEPQSR
ncbi:PQQ-dependent sugar dehydrogenase [Desulfonatronovibrio hydrogenovorans]|uniref:PQQ-dependent sugar dehydrogenase n=1 Tax=Desulfonatronovibrio hydrogenovorans TaxID=53245 RepID=UPI00048F84FB|nr:PQQ-dependent sugar dehydrogenase [Desulfonatronovibrio hydrogenovorans]